MIKNLFRKLTGQANVPAPIEVVPAVDPAERKRILREANVAFHSRQFDKVAELIGPLLQANKDDGDALALEGMRQYELGNKAAALNVLYYAIEKSGAEDPLALKCLVLCLATPTTFRQAFPFLERALVILPNDPMLLIVYGNICIWADNQKKGAEVLNKAIEFATREQYPGLLFSLQMLAIAGGANFRQAMLSPKAENIKRQVVRQLLANKQKLLNEDEARFLIALSWIEPVFFERANQEVHRLYCQPMIEDFTADLLGRHFSIVGDLPKSLEMSEQVAHIGNAALQYFYGLLLVVECKDRWFQGWQKMDEGFAGMYQLSRAVSTVPLWEGQRLGSRKLFIYQDQGFGDMLLAIRLLKAVSKRRINAVFWIKPDLAALARSADTGMEIITSDNKPDPIELGCAYSTPSFNLVHSLKIEPAELKQPVLIEAPTDRCEKWRDILRKETRPRVGLAVLGNPWRTDDWYRSVLPKGLKPFKQFTDICWVNLSVDARPEREALIKTFGALDPTADLHDFADTAAIISELDIVIAVDCSVGHLAAALGKPVLVFIPNSIDWRWHIGNDMSFWWPTAKGFQSSAPGQWEQAVLNVTAELKSFLAKREPRLPGV
jgi:hypothetical protein